MHAGSHDLIPQTVYLTVIMPIETPLQIFSQVQQRSQSSNVEFALYTLSVDDKNARHCRTPLELETCIMDFYQLFPNNVFKHTELDVGIHVIPVVVDRRQCTLVSKDMFYCSNDVENLLSRLLPDLPASSISLYPKLFSWRLSGSKVMLSKSARSANVTKIKSYSMLLERLAKGSEVSTRLQCKHDELRHV